MEEQNKEIRNEVGGTNDKINKKNGNKNDKPRITISESGNRNNVIKNGDITTTNINNNKVDGNTNKINDTDNADDESKNIISTLSTNQNNSNSMTITNNRQNDEATKQQRHHLTTIYPTNHTNLPLNKQKKNKKKTILKYLFWVLTICIALLCLYFFITAAITEAIITFIAAIIVVAISILITKCLNDDKRKRQINTDEIPNENDIQRDQSNKIEHKPTQTIENNKKDRGSEQVSVNE